MLKICNYTLEEEQAVEELKKMTKVELTPILQKDETLFYRVLKARDFNIKNAEALLQQTVFYSKQYDVEGLRRSYTPPKHMPTYFPSSFVGYDKEGYLVRYLDIGGADMKGLTELFTIRDFIQYIIEYLERDIDRITEQSIALGRPITQSIFILNMDKLNLFKVTFKKGLDYITEFLKTYQDMYPERIKSIYIINASVYFTIMYAVVKTILSSGVIKKVHLFGKTGWQDVLLDIIDADVLPAFLGGNRTDPDGNKLCNSFIIHGKPVPEELYSKHKKISISKIEGVERLTVSRLSSAEIVLNIYEPDTQIEWEFETKGKDIEFALYFKDISSEDPKLIEILPKQRVDTMLVNETGIYRCNKSGTYIVVFDNSYSWLYSKDIYYRIRLIKPTEQDFKV